MCSLTCLLECLFVVFLQNCGAWRKAILPCFQFQLSEGTQLPKLLHTIESIAITSHTNLFSFARTLYYLQNCKFWSMLKVRWRETHSVQFLKAPQMTKTRILQLKSSVDLMPATAKIHSQVTTTTSCKKHWSSPGAKSLNSRGHLRQEGPFVHICTIASYRVTSANAKGGTDGQI